MRLMRLLTLALVAMACTEHDPEISRRGAPIPDYGEDAGDIMLDQKVRWCQAFTVLESVCQHCHQMPPINGAPFPLMTFADTHGPYYMTGEEVWPHMEKAVRKNFMPMLGIDPTVMPLTCDQKTTLLGWLVQGATDEGGLDCTDADKTLVECGSVDTAEGGAGGASAAGGAGGAGP